MALLVAAANCRPFQSPAAAAGLEPETSRTEVKLTLSVAVPTATRAPEITRSEVANEKRTVVPASIVSVAPLCTDTSAVTTNGLSAFFQSVLPVIAPDTLVSAKALITENDATARARKIVAKGRERFVSGTASVSAENAIAFDRTRQVENSLIARHTVG